MQRIWAHQVSLFVPCSLDNDHPSSGLLSLRTIFGRLRGSMHNYFNSSRASEPRIGPNTKWPNRSPFSKGNGPERSSKRFDNKQEPDTQRNFMQLYLTYQPQDSFPGRWVSEKACGAASLLSTVPMDQPMGHSVTPGSPLGRCLGLEVVPS